MPNFAGDFLVTVKPRIRIGLVSVRKLQDTAGATDRENEEMKHKASLAGLMTAAVVATALIPAMPSAAQDSSHRQKTKNNWRNAAIGSGALGIYGLLSHNNTLTAVGAAGGLYSLNRYEHDRKSQSHMDHQRAAYYERSSFRRNGHRYVRRTVTRHGQRYYTYDRR